MSPYIVFALIGITLVLGAAVTGFLRIPIAPDIFKSLGITAVAVTMVEMLWRRMGGAPLSKQLESLNRSTTLLQDLYNTGIERFYEHRREVDFEKLLHCVENARQVDILRVVLQSNMVDNENFKKILENKAHAGRCTFRIIVAKPGSPILIQRAFEQGDEDGRLDTEARDSLRVLSKIRDQLIPKAKNNLCIKVNACCGIYCGIVRIDGRMLVTLYLSHIGGNDSPTFELHGEDSPLFKVYKEEFEKIWTSCEDWP